MTVRRPALASPWNTPHVGRPENICAGPYGRIYDFCIERERLMHVVARLTWGVDLTPQYASMDAIGRANGGSTILDVPCGGGVAFRALSAGQDVRYIAGDLLPQMLERAKRRAEARGLRQVELTLADMQDLPFDDELAELFLSYNGLHMVDDPEAAVREIGRCLAPGGQLIGSTLLAGGTRRQRALFAAGERLGHSVPPAAADLRLWLNSAGIVDVTVEPTRGFGVFLGTKRARPPTTS
jgi:SAM-dependent methyltransferase